MNDLALLVNVIETTTRHQNGSTTVEQKREVYYDGSVVERGGHRFRINFPADEDHEPPWDDGEGQGIVRELPYGENKKPGERILHHNNYARTKQAFDWQDTIAKAKAESWGLSKDRFDELTAKLGKLPTHNQIIEAAVEYNFQWMRRWCRDQWQYVGVSVTLLSGDGSSLLSEVRWGYSDEDADELASVVNEMIDETLGIIEKQQEEARKEEEEAAAGQERRDLESHDAAVAMYNAIIWSHFSESFKKDLHDAMAVLAARAGIHYPPQ